MIAGSAHWSSAIESQAPVLEVGGCMCTQVIVAIMDNWQSTGGVDEYVSWTGDANLTHGDFYTNKQCQRWLSHRPCSWTCMPAL